jgi:hypothetical protein
MEEVEYHVEVLVAWCTCPLEPAVIDNDILSLGESRHGLPLGAASQAA